MVNRDVGTQLRRARHARGLALSDVEAKSGGEFRASVLGAYERGERTLSVTRLIRIAHIYGVDPTQLLASSLSSAAIEDEIDLTVEEGAVPTDTTGESPSRGFTVDLDRIESLAQVERSLRRFVAEIVRRRRMPSTTQRVTIRVADADVLAIALGLSPSQLTSGAPGELRPMHGAYPEGVDQFEAEPGTRP